MAEVPKSGNGGDKGQDDTGEKKEASGMSTSDWLAAKLKGTLNLDEEASKPEQVLEEVTVEGIIRYIQSNKCKNIVTMAGAGISTSAGIPDFRSPDTGLYANLQKYNLPHPQAIFDISYFKENPEPFFKLAKELYPGVFKPTPCHYFLRLLSDKGVLLRHYTQNIDTLERVAGLPGEKLVEAHGTFHTAHCLVCRTEYTQDFVKEKVFADEVPHCTQDQCGGLVKPDIIFFGEALPDRFFKCAQEDLEKCDLLLVMGTSLVVQPFASLTTRVSETCPRLYINLEKSEGGGDPFLALLGMGHGFRFDAEDNYRDVFWQGTCDDGCQFLAEKLGWKEELKKLIKAEHARIDAETKEQKQPSKASADAEVKKSPKTKGSGSQSPKKSPVAAAKGKSDADAEVKKSPKTKGAGSQSPKKSLAAAGKGKGKSDASL